MPIAPGELITPQRGTIGVERKVLIPVPDGVYGTEHVVASAYVQFDLDYDNAVTQNANIAAAQQEALSILQTTLALAIPESYVVSSALGAVEPTPVAVDQAVATVAAAIPGTSNVTGTPAATPSAGTCSLKIRRAKKDADKDLGPLPAWLTNEYAIAQGVDPNETVWDNRPSLPQYGGTAKPTAPWFKGADTQAAVWPPR